MIVAHRYSWTVQLGIAHTGLSLIVIWYVCMHAHIAVRFSAGSSSLCRTYVMQYKQPVGMAASVRTVPLCVFLSLQ